MVESGPRPRSEGHERVLAEISISPQVGRDIRREIVHALEEIEKAGLRYEVEPFGTVVEADLEDVLSVLRAIHARLAADGVKRFDIQLRLRQEPGTTTIERETAGFRERSVGERGAPPLPGME
jgi:uncharacterized protein YqgV (UPF0045/DUF77 family)